MRKQYIILASIVAVTGIASSFGSTALVHAQSAGSTTSINANSRIKRFDMHARAEVKLNQAVRDGAITAAQKTSFMAELRQLRSQRHSSLSKPATTAQRQAAHAKLTSDLKGWASANNFPLVKIFPKLAS